MNSKTYIIVAAITLLVIGIIAGQLWSDHKIRLLEETINSAKADAATKQDAAVQAEKAAEIYKQKIEYLEQELSEIRSLATKQDEELQKLATNTGDARRDVERARRIRAIATTTEELCRKLAEVGHACD
jgi:predicted RNase H-like nuclease (RuvC/YqgF family)